MTVATLVVVLLYFANGGRDVGNANALVRSRFGRLVLCGSMVLYLLYHAVRCVHALPDEADPSARRVTVDRRSTGVGWRKSCPLQSIDNAMATLVKTALLMVALWVDAKNVWAMAVGLAMALWMVDCVRESILVSMRMGRRS